MTKHFSILPSKGDSTPCLTCNKPATENSFECIWCERLQHSDCLKINVKQYSGLSDLPTNIVFFCSECLCKLPSTLLSYDRTNEACERIEKKIDSVEVTLSNKFASLADQLSNLSSKLSHGAQELSSEMAGEDQPLNQESPCQTPLSVESIASMTASIVSEEKEKEKRKLNLIVHNYPEPMSTDPQARKKKDIENIRTLLNQYVNVPATIINAIRLGKRSEGSRLQCQLLKKSLLFFAIVETYVTKHTCLMFKKYL